MTKHNFTRALLVVVALMFGGEAAHAGSASSNMNVTSSIANNCTISTPALAFGAYDPIVANAAVDLAAQVAFSITCTNGASTTIDLGQGANAAGGSTPQVPLRQMINGGNKMSYYLYTDAPHTTVWGAAGATRAYTGTGAADASVICYGKIPSGQSLPAGAYTDTVVATINF